MTQHSGSAEWLRLQQSAQARQRVLRDRVLFELNILRERLGDHVSLLPIPKESIPMSSNVPEDWQVVPSASPNASSMNPEASTSLTKSNKWMNVLDDGPSCFQLSRGDTVIAYVALLTTTIVISFPPRQRPLHSESSPSPSHPSPSALRENGIGAASENEIASVLRKRNRNRCAPPHRGFDLVSQAHRFRFREAPRQTEPFCC